MVCEFGLLIVTDTYPRIRDRLQAAEKFGNSEIDIDNLRAELALKARKGRCPEEVHTRMLHHRVFQNCVPQMWEPGR